MFSSHRDAARRGAAAVLARRAARIGFGLALSGGMITLAYVVLRDPRSQLALTVEQRLGIGDPGAAIIVATWLAALAGYAIVWLGVRLVAPVPRGDALLRASLVVPAIGLALALPLGLHLAIFGIFGVSFENWAATSICVVGFAHLVFAATFAIRAAGLARTSTPRMSGCAIYVATVGASLFPLGMVVLPEVLTALTGVLVLPVLYALDRIAAREREALPRLPAARARML